MAKKKARKTAKKHAKKKAKKERVPRRVSSGLLNYAGLRELGKDDHAARSVNSTRMASQGNTIGHSGVRASRPAAGAWTSRRRTLLVEEQPQ